MKGNYFISNANGIKLESNNRKIAESIQIFGSQTTCFCTTHKSKRKSQDILIKIYVKTVM